MHTATLHELLRKNVKYEWNATYQDAFDHIKSLICGDTAQWYYDVQKPVIIQADE